MARRNRGVELFSEIMDALVDNGVPNESRYNIYLDLIKVFESEYDTFSDGLVDCMDEDKEFKRAYIELNGDPEEENEDVEDDWREDDE